MLKILHVGMSYELGGIEQFYLNYLENIDLDKCRFDFINVFENNKNQFFYKKIIEKDSTIYNIADYRKHPIKFYKEFKKVINENEYDIIHYSMNSAVYLLPLIVAKKSNAKVVIAHSHNASSDKGFLKDFLHSINKHLIPIFANTFFACSNKAGEWFFSKKIMNSKKYFVINNAIDIQKFYYNSEDREELRNQLNISKDTILLGHVGRFQKQKNQDFLINMFYKLNQQDDKYKMILVGIGPLMEQSKELVKKYNLEDKIIFLGQRNDVNKLFQAMDIFLLPSLYEGLPLVGVEAQASGVKCIFSKEITREVELINTTKFIDIGDKDNLWIDEIRKYEQIDRKSVLENSNIYKYDLKCAAKELLNIYMDLNKEQN